MQEYMSSLTESQRSQVVALLGAGVANGRWKEGLMFEGIAPGEDMFSSMQYYPGTEELLPDEMRVTLVLPVVRAIPW